MRGTDTHSLSLSLLVVAVLAIVQMCATTSRLTAQPLCDAHFSCYANPHHPDSVHFYPTATNGSTAHYVWTFGDGTTSTLQAPWHHYAAFGTYIVCLTVTDTTLGGVCSDTWCDTVDVTNPPAPVCNAQFYHYANPHDPDSVHFYPATNGSTARYAWTFGDGTTSTVKAPWHHYAAYGTYIVCLTVTDTTAGGVCTDTKCDTVIVVHTFQIYPNPANGRLRVAVPPGMTTGLFEVRDARGHLVYRNDKFDPNGFTIPTDGMDSGVYFYRVMVDGNMVSSGKFVVLKSGGMN